MFQYFKALSRFVVDLYLSRNLVLQMTTRDFKSQYFGSYLGLLWAFIQPTVTILIFWFIFEVGFKSAPVEGFPFLLWLVIGMTPWFFISDAVSNGVNSIISNAFLVKKVVFRVSMLPLVKVLSSLFVHTFFIVIIFIMCFSYKIEFTWSFLQVFYYTFCAFCLVVGVNWLTSSVVVFYKDIGQLVVMLLQICFWLTPIFWSLTIVPEKYRVYIKMNPVFYIVDGYRNSFIHNIWFWEAPLYTLYFWTVTGFIFLIGAIVFARLRPHFADVL